MKVTTDVTAGAAAPGGRQFLVVLRRLYRHIVSPPPRSVPEPKLVLHARNLAIFALFGGAIFKFTHMPFEDAFFDAAGLPRWMMPLVGGGELAMSLMLMSPATSTVGAIAGAALMVGAFAAVCASGWWILIGLPPVTISALIYVGWSRRADLVAWLGLSPLEPQ